MGKAMMMMMMMMMIEGGEFCGLITMSYFGTEFKKEHA